MDYGVGDACSIHDANNALVETVYERDDDLRGLLLAQRIVDAVNAAEVTQTQSSKPECFCDEPDVYDGYAECELHPHPAVTP